MVPFTSIEKKQIKETYGSMGGYRKFLWEEIRLANALSLDGNSFHKAVMKKAEELYEKSLLKNNRRAK